MSSAISSSAAYAFVPNRCLDEDETAVLQGAGDFRYVVPWLASQADMLANDWQIIDA